jgi:Polyketide cyclase / dehydrase and lipid transport
MSSWRQQALIEAPLDAVWELVGDPTRYPEWAGDVLEVTGVPRVEPDATFQQVTRTPLGETTTTFRVEQLDAMRSIRMRCQASGYYSHWTLTEVRGDTFVDVEIGMDPIHLRDRVLAATLGKSWFRRVADRSLDGLRAAADGRA